MSVFFLLLFLLPLSISAEGTVECHHSIEMPYSDSAITIEKLVNSTVTIVEFVRGKSKKGTKLAGCYKEGNSTTNDHCCCNTGNGCSIGVIARNSKVKATTTCTSQIQFPDERENVRYNDCEDPFCYTFMSSIDHGVTSVWRGCMATTIEDKLYKNNTKWESFQYLIDMPRCEDVVSGEEYRNGTESNDVSKCVEYEYDDEDYGGTIKKRLCCCKGKNKCNDEFGWNSPSITLDQIVANKHRRTEGTTVVDGAMDSNIFLAIITLISLYILK
ncbi:hypothetical protein PRIPAC_78185 [Pristionchus pacificus]|uniref:Uncharacterized protein n=1 Tax=Pristionchus pacificus TaxID=54126 RepID=A0A2A6BXR9_PRIPA|nr:hypothetical protein PRIPAC_78185 [Pristionchus pacificus]|eukprot:PDM70724.1 hypothetical protein PRIPAC_44928 [Pristionchus pacificus]